MTDRPVNKQVANDTFRKECIRSLSTPNRSAHLRGSPWITDLSASELEEVLHVIAHYTDWSTKTDLRNDHSAGVIVVRGHTILWVIKEYDPLVGAVLTIEPILHKGLFIKHSAEV